MSRIISTDFDEVTRMLGDQESVNQSVLDQAAPGEAGRPATTDLQAPPGSRPLDVVAEIARVRRELAESEARSSLLRAKLAELTVKATGIMRDFAKDLKQIEKEIRPKGRAPNAARASGASP